MLGGLYKLWGLSVMVMTKLGESREELEGEITKHDELRNIVGMMNEPLIYSLLVESLLMCSNQRMKRCRRK